MTDQERLDKLDQEFHSLDLRQTSLETFMKLYVTKTDEQMRIQREELKKHDERMDRMDEKIDRMDEKIDRKFNELSDKIDNIATEVRGIGRYVNALVITTIVGIAGITYTLVTFVQSVRP